jgi:transposase, mutator family
LTGKKSPYVYVDGIYLRRNWGGEYENAAILVATAVNQDGFREVIGAYSPFLSQHFLDCPEI